MAHSDSEKLHEITLQWLLIRQKQASKAMMDKKMDE